MRKCGLFLSWVLCTKSVLAQVKSVPPVVDKQVPSPQLESSQLQLANFVDIARLVLETTKAQTESVFSTINFLVGVGTAVVAILVALAAFFGYREWKDLKRLRDSFQLQMDKLSEEMRQEINAQIELTSARAEIDTALRESEHAASSRMYRNAIVRIQSQLSKSPHISSTARIRGLADVAFAKKRLGETSEALNAIEQALIIEDEDVARRALLTYNAACYAAIVKKFEICEKRLGESIRLDLAKRGQAGADDDFKNVRELDWFIRLTQ